MYGLRPGHNDLSKDQREILIGTLLGDAHLETQNSGRTYRLKLSQSDAHKAYLFHMYEIFKNLTKTPPRQKSNGMWYFNTLSLSCFRFYAQQFYSPKGLPLVQGAKSIPKLIHR
jgi:hypothetical protein